MLFDAINLHKGVAKGSFFTLGTIRSNRASGCSFSTDVDMRKRGRRAFEEKDSSIDGVNVRIVNWYDNRAVQLASSCCGVQTLSTVGQIEKATRFHQLSSNR